MVPFLVWVVIDEGLFPLQGCQDLSLISKVLKTHEGSPQEQDQNLTRKKGIDPGDGAQGSEAFRRPFTGAQVNLFTVSHLLT
ncbi:MAG: hypothetical protein ABI779_16825 [Acidobacteriota bacterium]